MDYEAEIAEALIEGRRTMESLMVDACRITRIDPNARANFNEATMQYDLDEGEVVYEGKCRIQADRDQTLRETEAADREQTTRSSIAQLPIAGTGHISADCVLELTGCPNDPDRVGATYSLRAEISPKTHATCRRFYLQEVVA